MRFALTEEQQGFGEVLDDLLAGADTPRVVRAWADGDPAPGLKLWHRLAELGVTGLLVAEERGGLDASEVDLVVAFEALGRHAAPGPWVESVALLPVALRATQQDEVLAGLVSGETRGTVTIPDLTPYALDADVAAARFVLDRTVLRVGSPGDLLRSVDPARRLFALTAGAELAVLDEPTRGVDVATKSQIYALVRERAAAGCAVLVVSSELPELLGICDRILVLHEGRVGGVFDHVGLTEEELLHACYGRSA